MSSEREQRIPEVVASIQQGVIPPGVHVYMPGGAERPGVSTDPWADTAGQATAGEEDQSVPGWDDLP
jgi:hypothetical protein